MNLQRLTMSGECRVVGTDAGSPHDQHHLKWPRPHQRATWCYQVMLETPIHWGAHAVPGTFLAKTSHVRGLRKTPFRHYPWVWATGQPRSSSISEVKYYANVTDKGQCLRYATGDLITNHIANAIPFRWKMVLNIINMDDVCVKFKYSYKQGGKKTKTRGICTKLLKMVVFAGPGSGQAVGRVDFHVLHSILR